MTRKTTCLARAAKCAGLGDIKYGCTPRPDPCLARPPALTANRNPIATAGRSIPGRQSRPRLPRETAGTAPARSRIGDETG